jgi:P4 family phage/plasmid primase-like protien
MHHVDAAAAATDDAERELREDLAALLAAHDCVTLVARYAAPPDGREDGRTTAARQFCAVDDALAWVRRMGAQGASLYVHRNPVARGRLFRRDKNRDPRQVAEGEFGNPPSIEDVAAYEWMVLDVDPLPEADQADVRARAVEALRTLGLPLFCVMDSGRGVQAQLRLAEPAEPTEANRRLYRACARALHAALAVRLRGVACEVDESVKNVNRFTRLVGTVNQKTGRRAAFLERAGAAVPHLAALAALLGVEAASESAPVRDAVTVADPYLQERVSELVAEGWEPSPAQCEALVEAATAAPDPDALSEIGRARVREFGFPPGGSGGERPKRELQLARELLEAGEPVAGVAGFLAQPGRHCTDGGQGDPRRALARNLAKVISVADLGDWRWNADEEMSVEEYAAWYRTEGPGAEARVLRLDDDMPPVPFTEDEIAQLFVDQHVGEIVYCAQRGVDAGWHFWRGHVWRSDEVRRAWAVCRNIARRMAATADEPGARLRLSRAQTVAQAARLAGTDPRIARSLADFDRDPDLLNAPNGVLHLPTGELRPHDRGQLMTKSTAVPVGEPGRPPERFLSALRDWTGGDEETIAYLQQVCGLALSGRVLEHVIVFVWGPGANGKSALVGVLRGVLGDYAVVTPTQTLTVAGGQQHPTDLASLRGARLVVASETEQGVAWAEARIKQLTGGDPIAARFMRQDFFTYTPQFTLLVVGNHRPSLRTVDAAIARRMHLIPFSRVIPPDQQDRRLVERLIADEGPAILRWMVEGFLAYCAAGKLERPAAVAAATQDYLDAENDLGQWLAECTEKGASHRCLARDLYESWRHWCQRNGVREPGAQKTLTERLTLTGHRTSTLHGVAQLHGIALTLGEADRLKAAREFRADDVRAAARSLGGRAQTVAADPAAGAPDSEGPEPPF